MSLENRTARLTLLIDPRKKAVFEHLCAEADMTPSQVVRKLIRDYIEQRTGQPWRSTDNNGSAASGKPKSRLESAAR
ncbi:MAG TPA: hypothetical protein VJQ50_15125 [Terriglobales bacterium]|nr:hypothetical protein [Terriglobales bacterium]